MTQEFIEITIGSDGAVESEVHGVMGPDCAKLVDWLDEVGEIVEDKRTPDYARHQTRRNRIQARR